MTIGWSINPVGLDDPIGVFTLLFLFDTPERLRSAVSTCLLSRFPAHIAFLSRVKHPAFLARSFVGRSSQCR